MKLKGYIFYKDNLGMGEILQGCSNDKYEVLWEALQNNTLKNVQGYLVLKEEEDDE